MKLASVTFAYPHVPGGLRAELATRLGERPIPEGAFVLSTCLRIEVLVEGDRAHLENSVAALFDSAAILRSGVVRTGHHSLAHLFRVAAGLESPIVGEREILTQFRQALSDAEEAGTISGLMAKLLEAGVAEGRQVRAFLPDSPHDSMAAVAAQLVGAADRVAVLGAGSIGRAVVANLLALPAPPEVTLIVRSPENVQISGVEVAPMSVATDALVRWPAVVSATSAGGRLVAEEDLGQLLSTRSEPLTLVDLAMPPDFTPPATPGLTHFDIDDIARRSHRTIDTRAADDHIEAAAVETFRLVDSHHEVGPIIALMMRSADDIVERSVERFAGRLGGADDRRVLRQAAHTVARTLLAGPVSYLRSTNRPPEALDLLAEAFGLEDDS